MIEELLRIAATVVVAGAEKQDAACLCHDPNFAQSSRPTRPKNGVAEAESKSTFVIAKARKAVFIYGISSKRGDCTNHGAGMLPFCTNGAHARAQQINIV